jgi:hypothetical protein
MHIHPSSGGDAAGCRDPRAAARFREGHQHGACKVVGLGAPVSVRIRFDACELPIVKDALAVLIAADDALQPSVAAAVDSSSRATDDQRAELRRMLDALGGDDRAQVEAHEVVWPTSLAHGVVRNAARVAAERLREALDNASATDAIQPAARAFLACAETWSWFRAVDGGGLPDVWL